MGLFELTTRLLEALHGCTAAPPEPLNPEQTGTTPPAGIFRFLQPKFLDGNFYFCKQLIFRQLFLFFIKVYANYLSEFFKKICSYENNNYLCIRNDNNQNF
nr:MAG TPA: hypothetical protein [Caudoviricetes sp.]